MNAGTWRVALRTVRGHYSSRTSEPSTGVERATSPPANDETSVDGDLGAQGQSLSDLL